MLWPERKYKINVNLIEQDFGEWEGKDYSRIPNIGFLNNFNLYKFAPPNGESQRDLSSRVRLEILEIAKKSKKKSSLVVAHAGTIRTAISLTMRCKWDCLNYNIDNLSITRIKLINNGNFSLIENNIKLKTVYGNY